MSGETKGAREAIDRMTRNIVSSSNGLGQHDAVNAITTSDDVSSLAAGDGVSTVTTV